MKRAMVLLATLALVLAAGTAMAATTSDVVPVQAVILGSCSFTTSGSIDFGSLDPVAAPAVAGVVTQPEITCTNGMNYTISDDTGANEAVADTPPLRMVDSTSTNFIPYSISYTAAKSGTGAAQLMDITANIAAGAYTGFPADTYTDTITLTVTW